MKVCILSMQNVQNFGSLLQGYSLKKILEELGHEVSFIPIEPNEKDNALMSGIVEDYSSESGIRGGFTKLRRIDKYLFNRIHIKKLQALQDKEFDKFRKDYLKINTEDQLKHFDYCVIGSDEVFNCNISSKWGFTGQLFGDVRQADKVITYAASCGSTKLENVQEIVKERIKCAFKKVSAFSVRDENTKRFTQAIAGHEPELHLDPVVIGNFDTEMEGKNVLVDLPEHYCIVYSYYNRFNNEQDIAKIKRFCKLQGLELISVGAPQMWIKNHVVCDPFEMLTIFQNAEFVITDTFHGTVFSAKYTKNFAVILRESNKNKLLDLIGRLRVEKHLIDSIDQLELVFSVENDFKTIRKIESEEYKRSYAYLKKAIQ